MKSVGSAVISFGLVSIPVKIYLAAAPEKSPFHWISPQGNRVSTKCIDATTKEEIEREGIQTGIDESIVLTDIELESLSGIKDECIEMKKIISPHLITPYNVERTYFLSPDKNQKPYRVLQQSLQELNKISICKWYTKGKDYLVAIVNVENNLLMMYQLFYKEELRKFDIKFSRNSIPDDTEMNLAKEILTSMSSDNFNVSQYQNEYNNRLKNLLEKKQNENNNIVKQLEESLDND